MVFALPTVYPVSWLNLNWTPVTVGVVLFVVLFSWYLPGWGARQWYLGKGHTKEDAGVASWRLRPSLPGAQPAVCAPRMLQRPAQHARSLICLMWHAAKYLHATYMCAYRCLCASLAAGVRMRRFLGGMSQCLLRVSC